MCLYIQVSGVEVDKLESMSPLYKEHLAREKLYEAVKQKDTELTKLFCIFKVAPPATRNFGEISFGVKKNRPNLTAEFFCVAASLHVVSP